MAAAFLADHVSRLRSARGIEAIFKNEILPVFGKRPITEISDADVARMLKAIAKTRPALGRNAQANLTKFFRWAVAQRCYGLAISPCAGLSTRDLIGRAPVRDRTLNDAELAAVWRATEGLGHAARAFVRLLILSGQRLRECASMSWDEIELDKRLFWVIPASRMKNKAVHVVPLAPEAAAILEGISRGAGPFVFSTTDGRRPISGFSKLKRRIDAAMPEPIAPWRFHDLRRSMRTGLSMLGVPDTISELVIAHSQKGLHRVYDLHSYLAEKRQALEKWERHLL